MAEYIELLRSGERSLRHELNRMLALSTVYGEKAVHDACEELLKSAVIGNSALEIELRRQYPPEQNNLKPEPIQFANDRLNRIVPVADLMEGESYRQHQRKEKVRKKKENA